MNKVSIVFICDNDFVMPTLTTITSLIKNKKPSTIYDINIIAIECSTKNIELFKTFAEEKIFINIIETDNLYSDIKAEHVHVSKAALFKFNLINIFPNTDKIIYLDGDLIITDDLSSLYNTDISTCYAGVVKDMKAILINNDVENYFNSGVMLLNLKLLRENLSVAKFLEIKKKVSNRYQDQDVFNYLFRNKVKFLSVKYNFITRYYEFFTKKQISEFFNEKLTKIVIYHYSSKFKPWHYSNLSYSDLWNKYYKKSPLKHEGLKLKKKNNKSLQGIQKIFSIRNEEDFYKVVRFMGIKLKFKQTKKEVKFLKRDINLLSGKLTKINKTNNFLKNNGINKEKILCEIENFVQLGVTEQKRNQKIIVSLTSYPARMYDIRYCLYSLLTQSLKPDEVILYLTASQFPNGENDIPKSVLKLKENGLSIKFYEENIKSHTKLIPALKEYPNDFIITADDDIFYDRYCVENLYNSYLNSDKKTIIANRCHKISIDKNGSIKPYKNWKKCIENHDVSCLNFATGVGGVFYPPNVLYKDIFNSELFMELAPNADDIWFWAMAVLNGTNTQISDTLMNELKYINPQRELNLNDDGTLYSTNGCGGNDLQMQNVLSHYSEIVRILNDDRTKILGRF